MSPIAPSLSSSLARAVVVHGHALLGGRPLTKSGANRLFVTTWTSSIS